MSWIKIEAVATGVPAENWQSAVRAAGRLLVDNQWARPEYIDAMLRTVKELGAYIVLAPGLAMPHARPEHGALQVGFSAITLKDPVEFGNPDNDPVQLVIAFCAPDHDAHIQSLAWLARRLEVPGFIQQAVQARDALELATVLNGD